MGKSVSVTLGNGSLNHNNRTFHTENVDPTLTPNNVVFVRTSLKEAYHEIFGEALEKYNQKQKRNDRKIPDYLEHIRSSKNGEKLFHELVIQVGDRNDTGIHTADASIAKEVLTQYYHDFVERNPNMRVFNAVIHMDEPDGTPHLHLDFIPIATGQKRGLEIKNSMRQALQQLGFDFQGTKVNVDPNLFLSYGNPQPKIGGGRWLDAEREALGSLLEQHSIEWDKLDTHREHLSVKVFKACSELIEREIEQIPPSTLETREPNRAMRLAGVKQDEVLASRQGVEDIQKENKALRAQAELQRQTIHRMDKDVADKNVYIQRTIKAATLKEKRAEKEITEIKNEYSTGTATKYRELAQKYNHVVSLYNQARERNTVAEQQNMQLKESIPEQVRKAVAEATSPLIVENNRMQTELERWKRAVSILQQRVQGLCQTLHDVLRAIFTLKYSFKDERPNPYKSDLTPYAHHLIDAMERKTVAVLMDSQQAELAKGLSGMSVSKELERDVQSSIRHEKSKGREIGE